MSPSSLLRRRATLLLGAALLLTGCQATLPRESIDRAMPVNSSAELTEYIGNLPYLTAEAAYRAVYALHTGEVFDGGFEPLSDALSDRKLIDRSWGYGPDSLVHRSSVGYMICRACDLKLGVNWLLTGMGRYAWRELQYRGIARNAAGELGFLSGGEFLGILARAEPLLAQRAQTPPPTAELGAAP